MTESPNKPEKTVLGMIKMIAGAQFLNSYCENAITVALNPTTMLVGLKHKSTIAKLHAMSTEDHRNRMKVDSCYGAGVVYWIWRTGDDEFAMEYTGIEADGCEETVADMFDIDLEENTSGIVVARKGAEGLTAAQVVEHIGAHNNSSGEHVILDHEMFELSSGKVLGEV